MGTKRPGTVTVSGLRNFNISWQALTVTLTLTIYIHICISDGDFASLAGKGSLSGVSLGKLTLFVQKGLTFFHSSKGLLERR